MRILVGSRESKLAVIQSEIIINKIKEYYPEVECELITMKTTGDKILDRTLNKVGGKGLFVKELDRALLEGRADITVHSLKDVPMELAEGIKIAAFSERAAAEDVLVLPKGATKLDETKPIGCASQRRALQLKSLFKNEIKPIRGNVQTRLAKLDSREYGALVLAKAGLVRLGLEGRISHEFSLEEILPAAGQGIIAMETRCDASYKWLDEINDKNAEICARAERAFVKKLDGGCSVPIAAYAKIKGVVLTLTAMDGREGKVIKKTLDGDVLKPENLGEKLAETFILEGCQ